VWNEAFATQRPPGWTCCTHRDLPRETLSVDEEREMTREKLMNVDALERALSESGWDVLVASSQANVFYTSGAFISTQASIPDRLALVVLPRSGQHVLILCNIEESLGKEESWIEDIRSYVEFARSPLSLLAEVVAEKGLAGGRIGIEKKHLSTAHFEELTKALPRAEFGGCDGLFDSVRATKTDSEVRVLAEAFAIAEGAVYTGFSKAEAGMTERAVLDIMGDCAVTHGAGRGSGVLASGTNTAHPHWDAGNRKLQEGDLVRVDFFGGRYRGYLYDLARTAVVGKPTPEQRDTYHRLWEVHKKTISFMSPGVRACDVYQRYLRALEEEHVQSDWVNPHVGHGIGIKGHEDPMLQPYEECELRPNMVFCVEPVYLVPGVCAYHIEDLVQITQHGSDILSQLHDTSDILVIGR
jgi:Xaa-Pro aminopeptidase